MKLNESQLRRIIREEAEKALKLTPRGRLVDLIFEDADPGKVDLNRFPKALSAAAADPKIKDKVTKGTEDTESDDDIVGVKKGDLAVSDLKPSQSTMKVANAVGMALGMLVSGKPGGDLGAFISSDNYIMDGHHRWIATYMVDPSAKVGGKVVNLPGEKLVAVLNAITAGKLGNKGNPGKGSFADFKDKEKIVKEINTVVEKGVPKFDKDGNPAGYFTTPEDAKKAVEEKGGADKLADMFIKNLGSATLATPSWAVERIEMPVINPGSNTADTEKALTGGEVDLNPPYYEESGGEKKPENAGRARNGNVILERWQRLAGLVK
jgi:hypothetical protein